MGLWEVGALSPTRFKGEKKKERKLKRLSEKYQIVLNPNLILASLSYFPAQSNIKVNIPGNETRSRFNIAFAGETISS